MANSVVKVLPGLKALVVLQPDPSELVAETWTVESKLHGLMCSNNNPVGWGCDFKELDPVAIEIVVPVTASPGTYIVRYRRTPATPTRFGEFEIPESPRTIKILGGTLDNPVRFITPLEFTPKQRSSNQWLSKEDRFYHILGQLGSGGFSLTYLAIAGSSSEPDFKTPLLVIKLPNLNPDYNHKELSKRKEMIHQKTKDEWSLTTKKLENCNSANCIVDFSILYLKGSAEELWGTVQPYVADAKSFDEYLVEVGARLPIAQDDDGNTVDNFTGVATARKFYDVVRVMAVGLLSIHQKRVVHGDVWPDNIYFCRDKFDNPYSKFIDFGEAFSILPTGKSRDQTDHPYRAPERGSSEIFTTEQADVYSFGKLMLYIATGAEETLSPELFGHNRRAKVRQIILDRNRRLAIENPSIVDLICHCVSFDPVARPRMVDVLYELDTYIGKEDSQDELSTLDHRVENLKSRIASAFEQDRVLGMLAINKLAELEILLQSMATDMVDLLDTRASLLNSLSVLFASLGPGDSYSCITSPNLWQENALGLDGRFLTATTLAVKRRANIHRSFAFSVQDVGQKWVETLLSILERYLEERGTHIPASRFKYLLENALRDYKSTADFKKSTVNQDLFSSRSGRERLLLVLDSIQLMTEVWLAGKSLSSEEFGGDSKRGIQDVKGLYVGLIPVGSTSEVLRLKADNPVSLIRRSRSDSDTSSEWLLVATDCRGRHEYGTPGALNRAMLRGVRVFRSIQGEPKEKKQDLEEALRDKSVNIGCWIVDLLKICREADSLASSAQGIQ